MTKLDGWWLVWGFNSSDKTRLKSWHLRKIKWPTILFIWPRRGGPPGRRTNRPTWPAQGCQTAQSAHAATTPWRRQLHTSFHLDCRIFCRVLKANYTYANTLLCVHWIGGKLSIAEKTAKNLSGILFCRTRLLINSYKSTVAVSTFFGLFEEERNERFFSLSHQLNNALLDRIFVLVQPTLDVVSHLQKNTMCKLLLNSYSHMRLTLCITSERNQTPSTVVLFTHKL